MSSSLLKSLPILAFALLFCLPARADELYTVSGVHVDASGASSAEALNPQRVLLLPDATEDFWSDTYRDLIELA
ncbi:MAG: hypothetical protein J0H22_10285 [Actinobacteria bacterium]|nr:hypothetical protein [Actinomycetota bacterium]